MTATFPTVRKADPAGVGDVLGTSVDPASVAARANDAAQRALVAGLRERTARAALGGSEATRARHVARGKLLPRERVEHLLDDGSPFLEIAPLAAEGLLGGRSEERRVGKECPV